MNFLNWADVSRNFVWLPVTRLVYPRYSDWLRAGRPTGRSSSSGRDKNHLHVIQPDSGAQPASCPLCTGGGALATSPKPAWISPRSTRVDTVQMPLTLVCFSSNIGLVCYSALLRSQQYSYSQEKCISLVIADQILVLSKWQGNWQGTVEISIKRNTFYRVILNYCRCFRGL
jgi:hypothetical protein